MGTDASLKELDRYGRITIYAAQEERRELLRKLLRAGRGSDSAPILPPVRIIPFRRVEAEAAARLQARPISGNAPIGYRGLFLARTRLAHRLPIATKN